MGRCDYCKYRNSWDCDDGYNRIPDIYLCENFFLDFDSLTNEQKENIQKSLLREQDINYD